ncbi:large ribosomal subunit protein uL4m-like [Symsagittifera roscoffensis]|uniref:large ribosomal subunit protein uL4m-like n=1 Tax=Symsagittifera roscoffensis TaxID=84072 RepID=UPI00307B6D3E
MSKSWIALRRSNFVLSNNCLQCHSLMRTSPVSSSHQNKNVTPQFQQSSSQSQVATHSLLQSIIGTGDPLVVKRWENFRPSLPQPKTAWIDQLTNVEWGYPVGLVTLHPDVWYTHPRLDLLREVVDWQDKYKKVEWDFVPNRGELVGGGPKPWPQKGTGKARQSSVNAPHWRGGAGPFGPRGPHSFYVPMAPEKRAHALRIALTCKYLQDDVKFVTDYSDVFPTGDEFLSEVRESRGWGFMALFIGLKEVEDLPEHFRSCVVGQKDIHYLPLGMISVKTLMKFPTIVMDMATLDELEAKLLFQIHKFSEASKYPGTEEVMNFMKKLSCIES